MRIVPSSWSRVWRSARRALSAASRTARGARVQPPSGFGQAEAARAASKQGEADGVLDGGDAAADGGAGEAELPGGLREAARLSDAGEKFERVGVQRFLGDGLAAATDGGQVSVRC